MKKKFGRLGKPKIRLLATAPRLGSGRVVREHYDELAQIWKGSPATKQLGFGLSSNSSESPVPNTSSESLEEIDNSFSKQLNSSLGSPEPRTSYSILDGDCDKEDDENDPGKNSYKIC